MLVSRDDSGAGHQQRRTDRHRARAADVLRYEARSVTKLTLYCTYM